MTIDSAESAAAYVREWYRPSGPGEVRHSGGASEANERRFRRAAADQRACANLCGDRAPMARQGHLDAAEVLEHEADLIALYLESQFAPGAV